jgi:hypothetical protein
MNLTLQFRSIIIISVVGAWACLSGCADDVALGTACASVSTDEPPGTANCVVTLSNCSDAALYEVVCTENITIECSCRRNSIPTGNFSASTLCPWVAQLNSSCGWDITNE